MRDLFTKDLGWKLFSLALAAMVWFMINTLSHGTTSPARSRDPWGMISFPTVPVLVVSSAADVREFNVHPNTVQVTVSGRSDVLKTLEQKDIHVVVDLTGIEAAQDLKKRVDVSVPSGVTVLGVMPAEVDVVVPPKAESRK